MADTLTQIKPKKKITPGAEYVSGNPYFSSQPRVLPTLDTLDLKAGKLSHEVIDLMLTDPDVYAALMLLALMTLNEKLLISPAITETVTVSTAPEQENTEEPTDKLDTNPAKQPADNADQTDTELVDELTEPQHDPARVARAKDIADFCQRQVDRVAQFNATMFEMVFEGMAHGNKVAEQVLEIAMRGQDTGLWCLKDLKTKPRDAVAFVVDAYMNELGMLGAKPGESSVVQTTMVTSADDIIPREKFAVFTYRPKNRDPRGNTALLAALNGWELKRRTFPEYLLFLMVSAIPGILATLPAGAEEMTVYEDDGITPKKDNDGNIITLSAHQFLLNMLAQMRNHQVGVAPDGTNFTLLEAANEGDAFTKGLTTFSKEITMAILFQQLATRDAEHQTKGSTGSQFRVIDLIVFWLRDMAADMVRYDIFKPMVRYNFGDDDADELLPKASYGNTEARDFAQDGNAVAQLAPHLSDSQLQHLLNQLGIPAPTGAEQAFKKMAKALSQQGQEKALQDGGDDGTDGNTNSASSDKKDKAGKDVPATTKK